MKIKDALEAKQALEKLKENSRIHLNFSVEDAFKDISIQDRKSIKGLVVNVEASHSGIINGNRFFYLPKGMANGADSFIKPFNKPVHVNHDNHSDPIGRVTSASYIDYNTEVPYVQDSNYPSDTIEFVMDFVKSPLFKDSAYKGLGHLELQAEITDDAAIQKILDKRYLTVSISGQCKDVTCSRCGTDIKTELEDRAAGKEVQEDCFHERGIKYSDNEPSLFWIAGDMEFDELSYVSSPADPNAVSRVANNKDKSNINICDMKLSRKDNIIYSHLTIKDENQQQESQTMKTKLKDFLSKPEDTLALVKKTLTDMKLEKLISSDEKYASLRKTSFLFADQRIIPIHDKAHVLAAFTILDSLEDEEGSKTLELASNVLKAKATRLFGDNYNKDDVLKTLIDENNKTEVTDNTGQPGSIDTVVIDYQKLADAISAKLTDLISAENKTSYEFLLNRNAALEKELEDALEKEKSVTDQIKKYIIDHILTFDQSETTEKLLERTVESLNDKLKDLKAAALKAKEDGSKSTITDANSGPADAGSTKVSEKNPANDKQPKVEFMDTKDVEKEYRRILKETGIFAAGQYIEELRKTNKVHKDFRLN